jgi:imidazolonepropionase-like amidohydrolase
VAEGCVADLLIVDGNPVDDPAILWSPATQRTIVQGGQVR